MINEVWQRVQDVGAEDRRIGIVIARPMTAPVRVLFAFVTGKFCGRNEFNIKATTSQQRLDGQKRTVCNASRTPGTNPIRIAAAEHRITLTHTHSPTHRQNH